MTENTWQDIPDSREKYRAYLCSREWREKRAAVLKRANGVCERCGLSNVEEIHHKTYARLYEERLDDLDGLCAACHQFVGDHSDFDPARLNSFRTAPRNLDAEKAVISSMLLMNDTIDEVSSVISAQSFYDDRNRRIAAVIFDLHKRGNSGIDAITVNDELSKRNERGQIGADYLIEILESCSSAGNAAEYARIIRSKATQRTVIFELSKIVDRAYVAGDEEIVNKAEKAVFALSDERVPADIHDLESILVEVSGEANERMESLQKHGPDHASGLSTGFKDLDNLTNGFQSGELIILASRPSMGKLHLYATSSIVTTHASSSVLSNLELKSEIV